MNTDDSFNFSKYSPFYNTLKIKLRKAKYHSKLHYMEQSTHYGIFPKGWAVCFSGSINVSCCKKSLPKETGYWKYPEVKKWCESWIERWKSIGLFWYFCWQENGFFYEQDGQLMKYNNLKPSTHFNRKSLWDHKKGFGIQRIAFGHYGRNKNLYYNNLKTTANFGP